jgi:hypothetical protein
MVRIGPKVKFLPWKVERGVISTYPHIQMVRIVELRIIGMLNHIFGPARNVALVGDRNLKLSRRSGADLQGIYRWRGLRWGVG